MYDSGDFGLSFPGGIQACDLRSALCFAEAGFSSLVSIHGIQKVLSFAC
jgi:hypothetical protein